MPRLRASIIACVAANGPNDVPIAGNECSLELGRETDFVVVTGLSTLTLLHIVSQSQKKSILGNLLEQDQQSRARLLTWSKWS